MHTFALAPFAGLSLDCGMQQAISNHLVRTFRYLRQNGRDWATCKDIQSGADVSLRASQNHVNFFCEEGIGERLDSVPPRYRLAADPPPAALALLQRIAAAESAYLVETQRIAAKPPSRST